MGDLGVDNGSSFKTGKNAEGMMHLTKPGGNRIDHREMGALPGCRDSTGQATFGVPGG
jgi:hypothetical protein